MVHLEDLRKEAKKVLADGTVKYLIGYKRASNGLMTVPAFIEKPEEVDQLVWEGTCVHNLSRYLVAEKRKKEMQKAPDERPIAIISKGCDSRAINVLIQEKVIKREDVYVIGVSCENGGVVDLRKVTKKFREKKPQRVKFEKNNHFRVVTHDGNIKVPCDEVLADRCLECTANYPVVSDVMLGETIKKKGVHPFQGVDQLEQKPAENRWNFWKENMDRCIRCYACRSVCPMCYCDECVVDSINQAVTVDTTAEEKANRIHWIDKSPAMSESMFYHMIRALHLAGRCVDCGECERVCPVDIPLRHLNKKMEKEAAQQFDYRAGFDPDAPSMVSSFNEQDPEGFIL